MMNMKREFSLLLLLFVLEIQSFNVDTVNTYLKYAGPPNSMFGFSVALHEERPHRW